MSCVEIIILLFRMNGTMMVTTCAYLTDTFRVKFVIKISGGGIHSVHLSCVLLTPFQLH